MDVAHRSLCFTSSSQPETEEGEKRQAAGEAGGRGGEDVGDDADDDDKL